MKNTPSGGNASMVTIRPLLKSGSPNGPLVDTINAKAAQLGALLLHVQAAHESESPPGERDLLAVLWLAETLAHEIHDASSAIELRDVVYVRPGRNVLPGTDRGEGNHGAH